MAGLLLKDFLNFRHYSKMLVFFILFFVVMAYSMDEQGYLAGMISLLFMMLPISSFIYDQSSRWELFAIALPVSRKEIVLSKYLLAAIFIVLGSTISIVLSCIVQLMKGDPIALGANFMMACFILMIGFMFISIMFPLIYKFGVEKSRLIMLVVVGIPTVLLILLSQLGIELPSVELLLYGSPIVVAVCLAGSFLLSYKIFHTIDL